MTKKELAELADLKQEAAVNRALRWSEQEVIAPDVPIPSAFSHGWIYNSVANNGWGRVDPAWSRSVTHGIGSHVPEKTGVSREGRALYSTKVRALRALRCSIEQRSAEILAEIDTQIAAEVEAWR